MEMAESMFISRNIVVALLALHSWKSFVSHWMQAVVTLLDTKESSKLNKPLKAANDIFKVRTCLSYSFNFIDVFVRENLYQNLPQMLLIKCQFR